MAKSEVERPQGGALARRDVSVEDDAPLPEADPGKLPDEPVDKDAEAALSDALAQLDDELRNIAKCIVWRVPLDNKGEDEYLYQCTVIDFARRGGIDEIARRYGSGTYRIRVHNAGKIYTHKRIKIGAPIVQDVQPGADVAALRIDMTTALAGLAAGFKDAIERIVMAQAKPLTLKDQLGDLVALKDFLSGGNTKAPSVISQLKDVGELLTTVKSLVPDRGAGDPGLGSALIRLGEKFLPEIVAAVKAAAPAGSGEPRAIGEIPEGSDVVNPMREMQLKMALDFLIDSAARGLPAETYADVAVDKVPVEDLKRLLNRGDWIAELNRLDARVADHQQWFTKLRAEIFSILRENGLLTDAPAPSTLEGKGSSPDAAKPPSGVS